MVAVAFQYTINGNVFQVGEFSNEGDFSNTTDSQTTSTNNLILKMLKSTITNVQQPVWKLMMKNIYNLGTYEFSSSDFKLDIFYSNPSPLNYLQPFDASTWPENLDKLRLLNVFDLDKLDSNGNVSEGGDGFFDVVDGVTVSRNGGLLIFPNAEPFGEFITKVDLGKDEQFKPEYLKISPFGKIPVIIDHENNKSIFESGAILMYLADKSGKLYDEKDRLVINQWLK